MNKYFVTYELAKLAKEKGFGELLPENNYRAVEDEKCLGWYEEYTLRDVHIIPNWEERNGVFHLSGTPIDRANLGNGVVAPLYDQLTNWFFKKGIHVFAFPEERGEERYNPICENWVYNASNKDVVSFNNTNFVIFKTKYDALEKGFKDAFKLI